MQLSWISRSLHSEQHEFKFQCGFGGMFRMSCVSGPERRYYISLWFKVAAIFFVDSILCFPVYHGVGDTSRDSPVWMQWVLSTLFMTSGHMDAGFRSFGSVCEVSYDTANVVCVCVLACTLSYCLHIFVMCGGHWFPGLSGFMCQVSCLWVLVDCFLASVYVVVLHTGKRRSLLHLLEDVWSEMCGVWGLSFL